MKHLLKIFLVLTLCFTLSSCLVNTAVGAVKTVAKAGYKVVKGTINGVSWAVSKAKGKIDKDKLDGKWKIVGVYNGSYDTFSNDENPENEYQSPCTIGAEIFEFNSKRSKFKALHCETEKPDWTDYDFKFGKNPQTGEKENYIRYNQRNYISVIDATNKTLVLEGNLDPSNPFAGKKLYMLEK